MENQRVTCQTFLIYPLVYHLRKGKLVKQYLKIMSSTAIEKDNRPQNGNDVEQTLLPTSPEQTIIDDNKKRNGTWFYAGCHSATAMIGAGVLSLPWALSYLGWILGSLMLVLAFLASFFSADLLTMLHEQDGKRFDKYTDLGRYVLGESLRWVVPLFQLSTGIGTAIAYIITGAESARQVYELFGGLQNTQLIWWIIGVGCVQVLLVQLPDYHSLRFVSVIGTLMAVGYAFIAIAASTHVIIENGVAPVTGPREDVTTKQVFGMANAVGSMLFAFGGLSTVLEIQSTLPSPSKPVMINSIVMAYVLAMVLYSSVAVTGYLAFGNQVKDNILVSTGKPDWLVAIANAMVMLHVMAGYQVFSMIVFMYTESRMEQAFHFYSHNWGTRLVFRTIYVILCVMVAVYIPFFGYVNGFVGAAGISMITFILPPVLTLIHFKKGLRLDLRILCYVVVIMVFLLAIFATAGTLHNIIISKTG
eukprot:TRINITY_DN3769_c0_g2_i1.p1 TRINITY_DN3769_c0_g2~~TRINITY_DN3769_c0_g2_i1.p1  ORF type:complete len:474 (+),score=27.90 TRINITY_DN3769_c0_g2_i1:217-1638(+)